MPTVFFNNSAYARLKAAKRSNESFSDVILRCVPQKINWDKFVGSCKGIDTEKIIKEIKKDRYREL